MSLPVFVMGFASCAAADPLPESAAGLFVIADFDDAIQNNLGGYYNKFEKPPSKASTFLTKDVYRGSGGRSLRVRASRAEDGFCGVWMHLFNFKQRPVKYFDAREYDYLSFWIKGQKGGERFFVKLADAEWIPQEDALPIGSVTEFLASGQITTEWQEVLIPIKKFDTLDFAQMGGFTLDFDTPGEHTVYIDDVAFKKSLEVATPLTQRTEADAIKRTAYPKAMWVWSIDQLINDGAARQELFAFCNREGIDQVWVQLLYKFDPPVSLDDVPTDGLPRGVTCEIVQADQFRQLNREAHRAGIKVHMLDGYPEYTQKEYHPLPLAIVDAVIAFNKASDPQDRFDGIHFDNEPYLLIGSRDRGRNEQILREFLKLNEEAQRRVRKESDMVYGVDIPFFWDKWDSQTGQPIGGVRYNGRVKPATYHCIDLLDNVGIMNYRDTADGADGMIAHGMGIMAYADKANKAKVYMGIETFTYDPTDVWFAVGLPHELFAKAIEHNGKPLSRLSRVNGFRTQIYDDGDYIHVGIEMPANPTAEQEDRAKKTVVQIAERLGASSYPQLGDKVQRIQAIAINRFGDDVEWRNPRERVIFDADTNTKYAGLVATSIMLPKITFAQESPDEIKAQVDAAEDFFSKYRNYAGIAIHYYLTYKKKLEEPRSEASGAMR